ncbi:MAG TPA: glycerol-3-phosphate dehydrogenase/oxidase [Gemmatimonadaceae bacterium]|jgi:glycerol-3-phosphate dehydrogenase
MVATPLATPLATSPTRAARFAALANQRFDVLIIGGGITGCGIARDAALRGLSVALVEKDDFASGTSSRSSRLVHGGLRYLENGYLHLVFESSAERRRLLQLAPHLVRPLQFTWPVYEGDRIPRWKLEAGLTLYDALSLFRNVARHKRLSRTFVLEDEPKLNPDGLVGGARYYDAATNDARLTLANALGASQAGAVVLNHARVTELLFEGGLVAGATVLDAFSDRVTHVRASVVVNATGPWSDDLRGMDEGAIPAVRGSKGVHIAVARERVGNNYALTLTSPRDGRVFFVLPADSQAIIGTTDTYTSATPDDVRPSNEDVRYLLDSANAYFAAARLTTNDVMSAWAGIRPLLPSAGVTPGGASREHAITSSAHGLLSITGGKLTTSRVMAADMMKDVLHRLNRQRGPDVAKSTPVFGGDFSSLNDLIAKAVVAVRDIRLATHLVSAYGSKWTDVWAMICAPGGRPVVVNGLPYTIGELRYCKEHEMALTFADLFIRRTHLAFETRDHGLDAAKYSADALGWSGEAQRAALAAYEKDVTRIFSINAND